MKLKPLEYTSKVNKINEFKDSRKEVLRNLGKDTIFEFIRLRDFKGVEGGFWPYQE